MAQLFDRRVRVEVGGIVIEDLRVAFRVKKTIRKEPNTAEVEVTNLSRDTRTLMKAKSVTLKVFAGYSDLLSQIFGGDVRVIDHLSRPPDWVTVIRSGDGERAYRFDRINKSYNPGVRIGQALNDIVRAIKVKPGNALKMIDRLQDSFVGGYVANGRAAGELDKVLAGRGLEWSIQDGELQVLPSEGTTTVTTVLTPETGLVGSPEHGTPNKKDGRSRLRVTTLLQPQIAPGGRVAVQSEGFDGVYRAETVEHSGDTAGGEWYTSVEGVLVT